MRKYLLISTALFTVLSCSNSSKNAETAEDRIINGTIIEEKDSTEISSTETELSESTGIKIDIQAIKDCAEHGITSFSMDDITNPKAYINNSIIDNILGEILVNGNQDWFLKTNDWERFSCYQWEESEDYFLFTLLQQDESCCLTMYLCLTDKTGTALEIRQLGVSGGDGGWNENDWGEKMGFGNFKLYYDSTYEEEQYENGVDLGYILKREYSEVILGLHNGVFMIDTTVHNKTDTLILANQKDITTND